MVNGNLLVTMGLVAVVVGRLSAVGCSTVIYSTVPDERRGGACSYRNRPKEIDAHVRGRLLGWDLGCAIRKNRGNSPSPFQDLLAPNQ